MENLRYTIKLDTKNGILPELKIIRGEMDNITQSVKKTGGQFVKLTKICSNLAGTRFDTWVTNAQNITKSIEEASSSGVDFQQGIADLQAITGIVGKDLETITRAARDVGKESGLGAKRAVDAFTLLASQIQIDQIGLKGLLQLLVQNLHLKY